VASLLEVGTGFHPELTGRENIFLNGALLGYSQHEMEACFDQIVDFAELRTFIDASIRTYSSGMYARLGFSVATAHVPDILLVDEILSVGGKADPLSPEGKAELRDAAHLWGRDTTETEEILRRELGDKAVRIACIGPRGNHCR
jgi:ABC-type transport system involved in cytochrome c biogenesis ATPase subunit